VMLFFSGLVQGIVLGTVLALLTSGMTLIYRTSRIVNFAHGSLLAVAMYATYELHQRFGLDALWFPLIVAPAMFLLGLALYWGCIRPIRSAHHLAAIQLLLGFSIAIDALLLMRYGADLHTVDNAFSARFVTVLGTGYSLANLVAFGVAVAVLTALAFALRFTAWGRRLRAVAQDELAAKLCGVSVLSVEAITWALGIALLGAIAPLLGGIITLTPDMGLRYTVLALVILIVGGTDSLVGTIVAGILIGVVQTLGLLLLPGSYGSLLPYVLLVVVLVFRPSGVSALLRRPA
jgi:branched-chain amino acid transport system permease protein